MYAHGPIDKNVIFEVFDAAGKLWDIGPWLDNSRQSPAASDPSSNNKMDTDDENEEKAPIDFWHEVNTLLDQLAEMLGVYIEQPELSGSC